MKHAPSKRISFPWIDVFVCVRCQLFVTSSDAGTFFMMGPPPLVERTIVVDGEKKTIVERERTSYRWFQLAPAPGSLAYLRPFVAGEELRDEIPACFSEAA